MHLYVDTNDGEINVNQSQTGLFTRMIDTNSLANCQINYAARWMLPLVELRKSLAMRKNQRSQLGLGMNDSLGDKAARVFASQFYSAIGFGKSIQAAFDQARTAIMLEGIPEDNLPQLCVNEGIRPSELVLIRDIVQSRAKC